MIYTGNFKRMRLYRNTTGLTPAQIKAHTGCDTIINGVLFNGDGTLCLDQKVDGKWLADEPGDFAGIAWSGDNLPVMTTTPGAASYDNFITSCVVQQNDKRGRSAIGFKGATYTVLCTSDSSGAMTWTEAKKKISALCDVYIVVDGGGSSCCICPGGATTTSKQRATQNQTYLLIWEPPAATVLKKHKVCLDPGHGTAEPNCSPDKRYYEYKFAYDIANRVKALLEQTECFEVMLTKTNESETPSLSARAAKANQWGAELYISEHSNAVSGGWVDGTHGVTAWIYAAGGKREAFAKQYLEQCKELGIELFGNELYTAHFAVLGHTNMPACLIEHYFHTCHNDVDKLLNDAEIEKLAYAQACAICEYFNLSEDLIPLNDGEKAVEEAVKSDIIYRVQVGAFEDETNAEAVKDLLIRQGYKPYVTKEAKK
ncbi:MAG: N-acetylmuramoyl-L-alanine amidase [Clostridia bacterium]|nr:N-acetylmuramoyl-L-alanine amidase [Clostridia bacterium]